jgi:hypothetical protein
MNTSCRGRRRIDRKAAWEAASDRAITSQHVLVRVPRTTDPMRTVPVKYSAGPLVEPCEPDLLISIPESL